MRAKIQISKNEKKDIYVENTFTFRKRFYGRMIHPSYSTVMAPFS